MEEQKGLNLDAFYEQDEYVQHNGIKYIITAHVPRSFYDRFSNVVNDSVNIDEKSITKKDTERMMANAREITIDILSIKNDKKAVKKFINGLPDNVFIKVFQYIGNFFSNSISKKKEV